VAAYGHGGSVGTAAVGDDVVVLNDVTDTRKDLEKLLSESTIKRLYSLPRLLCSNSRSKSQSDVNTIFFDSPDDDIYGDGFDEDNDNTAMAEDSNELIVASVLLRRYRGENKPCFQFHTDDHTATVNVALSSPENYQGGDLHCLSAFSHVTHKSISVVNDAAKDNNNNDESGCKTGNREGGGRGGGKGSCLVLTRRNEGSAVVHQGSVAHGVSPITKGTRYALVVFFDSPQWRAQQRARTAARESFSVFGVGTNGTDKSPSPSVEGLLARPRRGSRAAHQYEPGVRTPGRYKP